MMKIRTFTILCFLFLFLILLCLSACGGSPPPTINCSVNDLASAIANANVNPDHDQIFLPEMCDFELGDVKYEIPDEGYSVDLGFAGLPSVTSPITITGNNSNIFRSTTPGTADFRIFHVGQEGSLTLVEVSLENGLVENYGGAILVTGGTLSINQSEFSNNHAIDSGGAIALYEQYTGHDFTSEVYIINSVFRNNTAAGGGAIYQDSGLLDIDFETIFEFNQALSASGGAISSKGNFLTIYNSTIRENQAYYGGGGIYIFQGSPTLHGVTLEDNTASVGGGLYVYSGDPIISNCQIRRNQAQWGGGMYLLWPNATISDGTIIEDNTASEYGGGICLDQNPNVVLNDCMILNNQAGINGGGIGPILGGFNPTISLNNCTVAGNSATNLGGGVYMDSGEWTIHNSTFSGNSAAEGGGFYNAASLDVINSTISGNQADEGGGVLQAASSLADFSFVTVTENTANSGGGLDVVNSWIYITNSIVAGNSLQNCLGNIQPFDTNLADDSSCGFSIIGNPLLEPLADNGGPTHTHAIASFGPAAEVADPCTVMNLLTPLNQDQRGVVRPQGAACDLGAYEAEISALFIPPMPACIYEATKNSNCRESDFNEAPVVEILLQGETAALVALNPENTYGKFALQSGEQCWIALNLMTSQDETEDCPVPYENPLQIPERKEPKKTTTCKSTLGEAACKKAGGTWVGGITEAPHCSCP